MKHRFTILLAVLGCLVASALYGVQTTFWQVGTFREMLKGTLDGVALSTEGSLELSPLTQTVFNPEQALALSIAADPEHHLYIGTGHEGKVFRVDAQMKGSLFFTAEEPDIFALAVGPDGALYVGSSPEGKIYRVAPDGSSRVFFNPKAKYIWALAFDHQGNLYAGTGDEGKIFKILPNGTGKVFYDSNQTHIMCLTFDSKGNLLAGSVPNGLIYRISPEGKAFVLYQADLPEIHDLVVNPQGVIFAAALGGGPARGIPMTLSPGLMGVRTSTHVATVTVTADSEGTESKQPEVPKGQQKPPTPPKKKAQTHQPSFNRPTAFPSAFRGPLYPQGKGSLIEILPNSAVRTLWSSNQESIFGLALYGPDVLFTTDKNGRIFQLNTRERGDNLTLLAETHESLVTRLLREGGSVFASTGNVAKLIRLENAHRHRGTYESPVKDAEFISHWGVISWRADVPAGTQLEFYTRAGNVGRPDQTWSAWSGPYTNPQGSAIQSPAARYLQWKAVFSSSRPHNSPRLDDVTVAYLNQNLAPEIHSFNVSTGGERSGPTPASTVSTPPAIGGTVTVTSTPQSSGSSGGTGSSTTQAPPTVLSWQASDPNGDDLVYSLYVKATDELMWHLLKKDLHTTSYNLDPATLPDGKYVARLVASDADSNPASLARKAELESAPFWIDNTPPQVQVSSQQVNGGAAVVHFQAQDATSPLQQAEVSTDGKPWKNVLSDDGIVDSQTETFTIRVEHLEPGEHIITLRAYDTAGNAGLGKAVIEVPRRK